MTSHDEPDPGAQAPAPSASPDTAPQGGAPQSAAPEGAPPQSAAPSQAPAPPHTPPGQPVLPPEQAPTAEQPFVLPPQYASQPGDPFAPVPRPPKTPWIAPQRKLAVTAIAIAAALVLLVLGGVGGWAISDHSGSTRNVQFVGPGFRDGQRHFPGPNGGPRHIPRLPAPVTPTPAPSAS